MDKKELIDRYDYLYKKMSASNRTRNMMIFGDAEKAMFHTLADSHSELAKKWIDKLEAICWEQYLTEDEAKTIISSMNPKSQWSMEQILKAVEDNGHKTEEKGEYNKYALAVAIAMIDSDDRETISKHFGKTMGEINPSLYFNLCYDLAIDRLDDEDEMFDIRRYFLSAM